MAVLYVASDNRGAGKTAFCAGLAHLLRLQGQRATVLKPLGEPDDPDVAIYEQLLDQGGNGRPRRAPEGGLTTGVIDEIKADVGRALGLQDLVLVEATPDATLEDSRQIVDALDARVVVVARFQPDLAPGDLSPWGAQFGERLVGYVINGLTRYQGRDMTQDLLPSMESAGLVCLGVIPEDRSLLGVTVGQLASHLEGRYLLGEDMTDGLIEYFLVGGLGMDSGLEYFGLRDKKAVIVRGDRPDIQMAALQTPTSCMVLTRGIEPIEYVLIEAELEEVPIVVVESDTIGTMEALNTVHERARFDHPAKLARYVELLEEHVDVGAILSGLGLVA